jgi:uncharacterized protein YqhQ
MVIEIPEGEVDEREKCTARCQQFSEIHIEVGTDPVIVMMLINIFVLFFYIHSHY